MIGIEIDARDLHRIAREFAATEDEVRAAWRRAKNRTARTLRTQARIALRQGLGLKSAAVLKARLRLRSTRDDASLWVGLNDLPLRAFGGRPSQSGSGVTQGNASYPGAFIGRGRGSGASVVFRRKGAARLPIYAVTAPIKDQGDAILEGQVMAETANTLMRNFVAEIRARTIYGVGG